ncbi:MAG: YkgJ family cysteine cluster protein [Nanobdellota archaeon]
MEISEIIVSLEKKLMSYCIKSCNAKCCHIGKLFVKKDFIDNFKMKGYCRNDGYYDFKIEGGCPLLRNNKCSIYNNPLRPIMCSRFPFFERGNKLVLASSCKAVKEGFFEDYLIKLNIEWEVQ